MRIRWSWFTKLGLWPRVALAISAGFITLFLAFLILAEQALHDSVDHLLEERLIITQMVAAQIDKRLEQAIFALQQAARNAGTDPQNFNFAGVIHELEVEGESTTFSAGLIMLDSAGRSISSYPSELFPPGSDLSGLSHIVQALQQNQVTISDPFQDPVDGQPIIAITIPIYHDNQIQGLVSGLIALREESLMTPLNQATSLQESEHAVIIDAQGRVIVSTFSLPLNSYGEHHTFYIEAMAAAKPVVSTVPFELDLPGEPKGHLHVMAFVPMENVPWGLAVGGDEADLLSGVQRLRVGLTGLGIAALVGIWVLTLFGTRRVVRPVQQLTDAAHRIAAGNLDAPLDTNEGGEIGIMAAALDHMRNQLLADITALADWNDKLEERVVAQTEDLRRQQALTKQLLGKLINAQEDERTRLARELHDEVGQALSGIELSLGHLENALSPKNEKAHRRLGQSRTLIERTISELRAVIAALRPGTLDQLGLLPALELVSDHTLRPNGVKVNIEAKGLDGRLPGEIETSLFRIAQEAISNVARHSRATSLKIKLLVEQKTVTMIISDDGQGFIAESSLIDQGIGYRLGIEGMKERASLVGGELIIESEPDIGTTLGVKIPISQPNKQDDDMTIQIIKLIVVDDHAIMREGLVKLLENEPDLQIVGLANNGQEAIDLSLRKTVDVMLLDIVMEDMTGLEAARRIISEKPDIKIVIVTMYEEKAFLEEALQLGVRGYFLKGSNSSELIHTIRMVNSGEKCFPPELSETIN